MDCEEGKVKVERRAEQQLDLVMRRSFLLCFTASFSLLFSFSNIFVYFLSFYLVGVGSNNSWRGVLVLIIIIIISRGVSLAEAV